MCGRYSLANVMEDELAEYFGIEDYELHWGSQRRRFNIPPTTKIPVIRKKDGGQLELVELRWGLIPFWQKEGDKSPVLNNARCETVATKPAFRNAFKKRRCLIPAGGFFEWQKLPDGKKQPFYIVHTSEPLLAFAGLWEEGEELSATIVTTSGNEDMTQIHDRMPVILKREDWKTWLNADSPIEAVAALLHPAPAGTLKSWPVSTAVNFVKNDDAALILPANPDEKIRAIRPSDGQTTLF